MDAEQESVPVGLACGIRNKEVISGSCECSLHVTVPYRVTLMRRAKARLLV